jgi:hypothetical protein
MTSSAVPLKGECAENGGFRHPKLSSKCYIAQNLEQVYQHCKDLGLESQF